MPYVPVGIKETKKKKKTVFFVYIGLCSSFRGLLTKVRELVAPYIRFHTILLSINKRNRKPKLDFMLVSVKCLIKATNIIAIMWAFFERQQYIYNM